MVLYLKYCLSLYNRSLTKENTKTYINLVRFPSPQLPVRSGSCQPVPDVLEEEVEEDSAPCAEHTELYPSGRRV